MRFIHQRFFLPGSESSVRLVDVDGDGLDDIITGLAIGKDISTMVTEPAMEEFCKSIGQFTTRNRTKYM